mgnify:CR=1 FL=1
MVGLEKKSRRLSQQERRVVAYHEAGHALVSIYMPGSVPIHKATIIPRGRALGMVQSLPERDKISMHYDEMLANLAMAMGGRVAEEMIFGDAKVSSGASGDIQMATQLARSMVTEYGFSNVLGRMAYATPNADMFHTPKIAERTQQAVDEEIKRLVEEGYETAKRILTEKKKELDILAEGLIMYETLSGEEIKDLLEGKIPTRDY